MDLEKMLIGAINNLNQIHMDLGDELDRAYQRGYSKGHADGRKEGYTTGFDEGVDCVSNKYEAYQKGLDDAWECARKIAEYWTEIDNGKLLAMFGITEQWGLSTIRALFDKQTPNEALLNIEAIEGKPKADELKVGDEVIYNEHKFIVFATETDECYASLFDVNGRHASASHEDLKKTGKHYDIDKILEEMKE